LVAPEKLLGSRGAALLAREGDEVGTIEEVYLDRETDRPEWALVDTGVFGTRLTFVPLAEAAARAGRFQVPYGKDRIRGAPNIEATEELSPRQEADLYAYYGLRYSEYRSEGRRPEPLRTSGAAEAEMVRPPATDDAMRHSEEELRVGRPRRRRGEVRLKKYVVTNGADQPVPARPRLPIAGEEGEIRRS